MVLDLAYENAWTEPFLRFSKPVPLWLVRRGLHNELVVYDDDLERRVQRRGGRERKE